MSTRRPPEVPYPPDSRKGEDPYVEPSPERSPSGFFTHLGRAFDSLLGGEPEPGSRKTPPATPPNMESEGRDDVSTGALDRLADALGALHDLAVGEDLTVLTYRDVVRWWVERRPALDGIGGGALLVSGRPGDLLVRQIFLNRGDKPLVVGGSVVGRVIRVQRVDDELRRMLGGRPVLIAR